MFTTTRVGHYLVISTVFREAGPVGGWGVTNKVRSIVLPMYRKSSRLYYFQYNGTQ